MPPTSLTPPRLMSAAPRAIHSARVYILPSAVSGPTTGISSWSASQMYDDVLNSSMGSSNQ